MIGVLPGHAALLSALGIGELSYTIQGLRHTIVVAGGFVEVRNDHVRVLADRAELATEIDVSRAEAALKRAQDRLGHITPGIDTARALNAMRRAQARLAAAGRPAKRGAAS